MPICVTCFFPSCLNWILYHLFACSFHRLPSKYNGVCLSMGQCMLFPSCRFLCRLNISTPSLLACSLSSVPPSVIQAFILASLHVQWHCRLWAGSTQCSAPLPQPSWWRRGRCTRWNISSTLWPCNTPNTPPLRPLAPSCLLSLPLHPSRWVLQIYFFESSALCVCKIMFGFGIMQN